MELGRHSDFKEAGINQTCKYINNVTSIRELMFHEVEETVCSIMQMLQKQQRIDNRNYQIRDAKVCILLCKIDINLLRFVISTISKLDLSNHPLGWSMQFGLQMRY